jgi:hypothetical protein
VFTKIKTTGAEWTPIVDDSIKSKNWEIGGWVAWNSSGQLATQQRIWEATDNLYAENLLLPKSAVVLLPHQNQMTITKFVPEIALLDRHAIAVLNRFSPRHRIEHGEMTGERIMKAGHQSIDHLHPALWMDKEAGKATGRTDFIPIPSRF